MNVDSDIPYFLSLRDLNIALIQLFLFYIKEHLPYANGLLKVLSPLLRGQICRFQCKSRIQDGHQCDHKGIHRVQISQLVQHFES